MGSTSLPALPPSFGFGVVKLGFLRRTASPHLVHSITALERTTRPLLPPSRVMPEEQRSVPAPLVLSFGQLSLLSLPQLCALVRLWVSTVIQIKTTICKTRGNFCSGTACLRLLFGTKDNTQAATRHSTALTTPYKSQELLWQANVGNDPGNMIYQYSNYHTFHIDLLSPYKSAGTKTYSGCCRRARVIIVFIQQGHPGCSTGQPR